MPNLAFISAAHIHIRGFAQNIAQATDGRKALAVWDDMPERGRRYAKIMGCDYVTDLDALIADPRVDGFVICSENVRHLEILKKVLPLGKPIFCEKPLVTRMDELEEIEALLKQSAAPLLCGFYIPRWPEYRLVTELIRRGDLGKILRASMVNAHSAAFGRWFDSPDLAWFVKPELFCGGAFIDLGTHPVHLLRTLFGPVKEVWAEIGNYTGQYPDVDDHGVAHLRFENGIQGTVTAGWTDSGWMQTGGIGNLTIEGDKGTVLNLGKNFASLNTSDAALLDKDYIPGKSRADLPPLPEPPDRMDLLVAIIRKEISPDEVRADLSCLLDAIRILDAAHRSAKSGHWEKVRH